VVKLNFPNSSRSYDARNNLIRFWAYDSALEISFFVEVTALCKQNANSDGSEAAYLAAFDAAREKIHSAACKVYSRGRSDAYILGAEHL
jgi:hypothetical protein